MKNRPDEGAVKPLGFKPETTQAAPDESASAGKRLPTAQGGSDDMRAQTRS